MLGAGNPWIVPILNPLLNPRFEQAIHVRMHDFVYTINIDWDSHFEFGVPHLPEHLLLL